MNFDCTTDSYDRLYAPWLKKSGELLDLAGWKEEETLLDLAGGTGIVAKEAVLRCAKAKKVPHIFLLDPKPRCREKKVKETEGHAESVETHYPDGMFDVVICRQAIGYINMVYAIPGVHKVLKLGGRFVFNSFLKPSMAGLRFRTIKEVSKLGFPCRARKVHFLEAHIRLFGHVLHVQLRLDSRPGIDMSFFEWHDPKTLQDLLRPWFRVKLHKEGRSLRWLCVKEES